MKPEVVDFLEYLQGLGYEDCSVRSTQTNLVSSVAGDRVETSDLETLEAEARGCTRCPLADGRRHVVFGSGDPRARLMFVGEAPGAREDEQGLPFVGPAGELLNKIIGAIGLQRSEVYIANMVKCRPPGNRDPEPRELAECRGFIDAQIAAVQPRLIVALGRVAAQALLQSSASLGALRGRWHKLGEIPVRATYHPAALLRFQEYKRPTWEDMQAVRELLRSPRDDGQATS